MSKKPINMMDLFESGDTDIFKSEAIVEIVVNKKGKKEKVPIEVCPFKDTGIVKEWIKKNPRPRPSEKIKDYVDELGRTPNELGIGDDTAEINKRIRTGKLKYGFVPDFADPKYLDELEKWNSELNTVRLMVILKMEKMGLERMEEFETWVNETIGLSIAQIQQLFTQVADIENFTEEKKSEKQE